MKRTPLLFAPLVAALAACGSVVIVPGDPRPDAAPADVGAPDAATLDGAIPGDDGVTPPPPPPPADVPPPPPPPIDVPRPPPPPPPPVDGGVDPLRALCAQVCDRMARDCGTATSNCVDQCVMVRGAPNYAMCSAQIQSVYACVARNGVTCGPMGMNQPARVCTPLIEAAQMCLNGSVEPPPPPPPPPPVDAGRPVYPGCEEACARADRACGTRDPGCLDGCSEAGSMLSGMCQRAFDAMLACVRTNGFVCRGGRPQPASACDGVVARLEMCFGGGGGGGGGTPPMPIADAGAPDR